VTGSRRSVGSIGALSCAGPLVAAACWSAGSRFVQVDVGRPVTGRPHVGDVRGGERVHAWYTPAARVASPSKRLRLKSVSTIPGRPR